MPSVEVAIAEGPQRLVDVHGLQDLVVDLVEDLLGSCFGLEEVTEAPERQRGVRDGIVVVALTVQPRAYPLIGPEISVDHIAPVVDVLAE